MPYCSLCPCSLKPHFLRKKRKGHIFRRPYHNALYAFFFECLTILLCHHRQSQTYRHAIHRGSNTGSRCHNDNVQSCQLLHHPNTFPHYCVLFRSPNHLPYGRPCLNNHLTCHHIDRVYRSFHAPFGMCAERISPIHQQNHHTCSFRKHIWNEETFFHGQP